MNFIIENWAELALSVILLLDTIVSLTPTKKDDQYLGYIKAIFNAFNKKEEGEKSNT